MKRFLRFLSFVLAFYVCHWGLSPAIADELVALEEPLIYEDEYGPQSVVSFPELATFQDHFDVVLRSIAQGDYSYSYESLVTLEKEAKELGYTNLPEYSLKLMDHARLAEDTRKHDIARYLVRQALLLSPRDARVHFVASSFYTSVGLSDAWDYWLSGVKLLRSHPTVSVSILLNTLLVVLTATTLSLLVCCVVQLVCNAKQFMIIFSRFFGTGLRPVLSPLFTLALLVAPLTAGMLGAVGCWGVVLSRYVKSARWLGFLSGVLVLGWAFSIPVVQVTGFHTRSNVTQALENINNSSYGVEDQQILIGELNKFPNNPLLWFTLGHSFLRERNLEDAIASFTKARELGGRLSESASLVNLGVAYYLKGDFGSAKRFFVQAEEAGSQPVELLFNLAQTNLALVNPPEHKRYYNLAKNKDPKTLQWLEERAKSSNDLYSKIATVSYDSSAYYGYFFKSAGFWSAVSDRREVEAQRNVLAESLVARGTPTILIILGFVLVGLGLIHRFRSEKKIPKVAVGDVNPSFVWSLLPGGVWLAGKKPIAGVVVLGAFFAFLILGVRSPNMFLTVMPVSLPLQNVFLTLSVIIVVGSLGASGLAKELRRAVES